MRTKWRAGLSAALALAGCARYPSGIGEIRDERTRCWKVKRQDRCDYFQYSDPNGKVTALGYDDNGDGRPEFRVDLLTVCPGDRCPHYVILLDGIPYTLVREMMDQGHFRLFYPPSKLVSCFPSMTDLAYAQVFGPTAPNGYEALWYDHETDKLRGGKLDYLAEKNAPWQKFIDYRAAMILDAIGYVSPGFLFRQELRGFENLFNRRREGTSLAYSVGTATVGTRKGKAGLIKCLTQVEQLCERLIYKYRGKCRITILADHGHNLTASRYLRISNVLRKAGFKPVTKLSEDPRNVVCIEFGLLTYSAMYTHHPEKVADALLKNESVNLAIYPDPKENDSHIVVRDKEGMAVISKTDRGYVYKIKKGDPLKLKPIVETLARSGKVTADGEIDDRSLFLATVDHDYPDPLARIHRAFNGLAQHPPDLIVTVKDGWFCGAADHAASVTIASTHGSLNQANSVTFVMSTIRKLPEAIRMNELREHLPEIMPGSARR